MQAAMASSRWALRVKTPAGARSAVSFQVEVRLLSWTLQESEIERHEYKNDSDVYCQPRPEVVPARTMGVEAVYSVVFFIAWPSQCKAVAVGQVSSLKMVVQSLILPAGFGWFFPGGVGPRRGTRHTSTLNPSCVNFSKTDLRMR
jgi:hypothetical protein